MKTTSNSFSISTNVVGTIAWTSPEILLNGEYSIYSDVFAFGTLIWEIVSRNSKPFGNLDWIETAAKIKKGERSMIGNDCPISIKNLIEKCWNQEAKQRPTMKQIIEYLEKINSKDIENEINNQKITTNQIIGNSISQNIQQKQKKISN